MGNKQKELLHFFTTNFVRGLIMFAFLLLVFVIFRSFVSAHYEAWIRPIANQVGLVYSIFFINELIVGFIPPEFFMFLHIEEAPKTFWKFVSLMTILSYLGGACAYAIGRLTQNTGFVKKHLKNPVNAVYLDYYKRFGGIVILIAAITPVPFALTSLLSGTLNYPFSSYLKYASLRFLRFYPYAYILYTTGSIDVF